MSGTTWDLWARMRFLMVPGPGPRGSIVGRFGGVQKSEWWHRGSLGPFWDWSGAPSAPPPGHCYEAWPLETMEHQKLPDLQCQAWITTKLFWVKSIQTTLSASSRQSHHQHYYYTTAKQQLLLLITVALDENLHLPRRIQGLLSAWSFPAGNS